MLRNGCRVFEGDVDGCRFPAETASSGSAGEAATIAAVVDTFVRAIETSDFERRLQLVEADHFDRPGEAVGMNGAGRGGYYNQ